MSSIPDSSRNWCAVLGLLVAVCTGLSGSFAIAQSQGGLVILRDQELSRAWDQLAQACRQGADSLPAVGDLLADPTRLVEWKPGHLVDVELGLELLYREGERAAQEKLLNAVRSAGPLKLSLLQSPANTLAAADAAWRDGDAEEAQLLWQNLLERCEHSSQQEIDRPALIARLVVSNMLRGKPRSALSLAGSLSKDEKMSTGHLHGADGVWEDLLQTELTRWRPMPAVELSIVRRRWSLQLIDQPAPTTWFLWNGQNYACGSAGLFVLSVPRAAPQSFKGIELESLMRVQSSMDMAVQIKPRVTMTPEMCVLRLGTSAGPDLETQPVLAALSADRPTELAWEKSGTAIVPGGEWIISGDPCLVDSEVIVPLRSSGSKPQWGLAGLSSQTGDTIWSSVVAALADSAEFPLPVSDALTCWPSTAVHSSLLGPKLMLANIEGKTILAISAETHEILWSRSLSSKPSAPHGTRQFPLLVEGSVALTLDDSQHVLNLNCRTGLTNWVSQIAQVTTIVGRSDNRIIVTGNGIQGLDWESGQTVWTFEQDAATSRVNAVLLRDRIVASTSEAVWLLDAETGAPLQRWDNAALGLKGLQDVCIWGTTLLSWNSGRCVNFEIRMPSIEVELR